METPAASQIVDDEWPQEPSGFQNLKFGWTKQDVEKHVTLEHYGVVEDGFGPQLDTPYPTLGVTHISVGCANITAHLIFSAADGLHCVQGMFPTEQFESLKSAFLSLYGNSHEVHSHVPSFPEEVLRTIPEEELQNYLATVESLVWYSDRVYIALTNRPTGNFFVASYSGMRGRGGWEKMREKAQKKLHCTQDVYTPPDGWSQEPDKFSGLRLDMTTQEAASVLVLGKCTPAPHPFDEPGSEVKSFLYEATLSVGGLELPGEVFFVENRLINIGSKFDKSLWDAAKSALIGLYGRPHCDERREVLDSGLHQTLDWTGDQVWIRLLNYPNPENVAQVYFQRSLKGYAALAGTDEAKFELKVMVGPPIPPPEPPKIEVEHTPSNLILHLPDGTTLEYPTADLPQYLLKSTWHRGDDEKFIYELEIDTTMLSSIRVGDARYLGFEDVFSEPEGWMTVGETWYRTGDAGGSGNGQERETTKFSITSPMLPGPMPLQFSRTPGRLAGRLGMPPCGPGDEFLSHIPVTLPRRVYNAVLEALKQHTAFLTNTFIIGPGIAPHCTAHELRLLAKTWMERDGFDFLGPMADDSQDFAAALDQLAPRTEFERQIVDCLRAVL